MRDDIPKIKQRPSAFADAFGVPYGHLSFAEFILDILRNGPDMPVGVPVRDDKVMRHRGELGNIQDDGRHRLLVVGGLPG